MKITFSRLTVLVYGLILLPALILSAKDFGFTLDQSAAYEVTGPTNGFAAENLQYTGTLIPWFSTPLNPNMDLYISAGATIQYEQDTFTYLPIPELLRTELEYRWDDKSLKAGRIYYRDALGFIAEGLFDGVQFTMDTKSGIWGFGAWYTGLLYKKNANITITSDELDSYNEPFDYDNFLGTYFAPRRLIAALDWEDPGFWEKADLKLALVGQFDLKGGDSYHHSQYLLGKFSIPVNSFVFDLGACFELQERSGRYQVSFASVLGASWYPATQIEDRLMLSGCFSGGTWNDNFVAFVPVSTEPFGNTVKAKLSGLSILSLDYTARLHRSFSISLSSAYFILSDLGTYEGSPAGRDGYFLGNEFYGLLVWSPISDLQIKAGGGIFLPGLGNADPKGDVQWKVELSAVLVIF